MENLLKIESMAPMGQTVLQNNLRCPITRATIANKIASLITNDVTLVVPLIIAHGTADSTVATGQSLQKYNDDSVVRNKGTAITNPPRKKYFRNLACLGIWNLGNGTLYSNSCTRPNGQTHPHRNLPAIIPARPTVPITVKGMSPSPMNWPRIPTGQENTDVGHEWQFNTGKHIEWYLKRPMLRRAAAASCIFNLRLSNYFSYFFIGFSK